MLDDCKGEKLEEVLVAFSTVVLQRVCAAQKNSDSDIVERLILGSRLGQSEHKSLLPLAIAHKAALKNLLERKSRSKKVFCKFKSTLDGQRSNLLQGNPSHNRKGKSPSKTKVAPHKVEQAKRHIGLHWQGSSSWLEVIVEGEEITATTAGSNRLFEQAWEEAQHDALVTEQRIETKGLL